jgi:hypothetical protein
MSRQVAFAGGAVGSLTSQLFGAASSLFDFASQARSLESGVYEFGSNVNRYGAALAFGELLGTNDLVEAAYGYDIVTGGVVDQYDALLAGIGKGAGFSLAAIGGYRYGSSGVRSSSRVTSDFAADAEELGGQLYGADKLGKLERYLARRNVTLEVGAADLPKNKAGRFIANSDNGTARLLLKADPTHELVWHELGHYIHWKSVGPKAYGDLPRVYGNNVPEQFVFDLLDQPGRWDRLSPEYRVHSVEYITEKWGGMGR